MVQERRCPVNHEAAINNVIRQCPFLASVSATEGTAQAARFVLNPLKASSDVNAEWTPIFPENELASMDAAFELIHSDSGILPLKDAPTRNVTGCPFHATASPAHEFVTLQSAKSVQMPVEQPFAGLPVASMSLSGPFGFLVSRIFPILCTLFNNSSPCTSFFPSRRRQLFHLFSLCSPTLPNSSANVVNPNLDLNLNPAAITTNQEAATTATPEKAQKLAPQTQHTNLQQPCLKPPTTLH